MWLLCDYSFAVGLDAAGKTTILYKLKLGEIVTTIPTIGARAAAAMRFSSSQASTLRRLSTRTSTSRCGMSEARTRSARSGATTSKTHRQAAFKQYHQHYLRQIIIIQHPSLLGSVNTEAGAHLRCGQQ